MVIGDGAEEETVAKKVKLSVFLSVLRLKNGPQQISEPYTMLDFCSFCGMGLFFHEIAVLRFS